MFKLEPYEDNDRNIDLIKRSYNNAFITGQAGTGKSTLLEEFCNNTRKNTVVLAPTGIAALNVNGQTIHSFFRFPASVIMTDKIKINKDRIDVIKSIDRIIIDEISMVRVDVMEGIDFVLRKYREINMPFGGVQIILFGDMFQLSPIIGNNADLEYISHNYKSEYFFDAKVFQEINVTVIELTKVYRQQDNDYIGLLNRVRLGKANEQDFIKLNNNISIPDDDKDFIYLTARRETAANINAEKLDALEGEKKIYYGKSTGIFSENNEDKEYTYPSPEKLEIKTLSKIIMLNNDTSGRWVNGSRGTIVKCDDEIITIKFGRNEYQISPYEWEKMEYSYNSETRRIEEKKIGTYTQFPVQLAYAITIHKSQGMTFDKVIVDIGASAFAAGQVYVALSRCRTFKNLIISNPIKKSDIMINPIITKFYNSLRLIEETETVDLIGLRQEFVREFGEYLEKQKRAGNFGACKVTKTFESAMFLAKFQNERTTLQLRNQIKFGTIEYSIEALCIKRKYISLVNDVRDIALKKLQTAGVDFNNFSPENRP